MNLSEISLLSFILNKGSYKFKYMWSYFESFFHCHTNNFLHVQFLLVNTYVFKRWTYSNTFADAKTSCITYPSVITKIHLLSISKISKKIFLFSSSFIITCRVSSIHFKSILSSVPKLSTDFWILLDTNGFLKTDYLQMKIFHDQKISNSLLKKICQQVAR